VATVEHTPAHTSPAVAVVQVPQVRMVHRTVETVQFQVSQVRLLHTLAAVVVRLILARPERAVQVVVVLVMGQQAYQGQRILAVVVVLVDRVLLHRVALES